MSTAAPSEAIHTLHIVQEIEIAAPVEIAFDAILDQLGPASEMPGGEPFPMKFEPWPGGRWFRDLGNDTGHHWAHVQVIKPPTLLELHGPLFMSYPAINFVQYRLAAQGKSTRLKLTHRAMGLINDEHRTGVVTGWAYELQKIKDNALRRAKR